MFFSRHFVKFLSYPVLLGLVSCQSTKVLPEIKEQVSQTVAPTIDEQPAHKSKDRIVPGPQTKPFPGSSEGWTLVPSGNTSAGYGALLLDIRCRQAGISSEACPDFLKLDSNLPTNKNSMPPSKKRKVNISKNMALVDTVVQGLSFKAIPQELATVMQNVANDDIPRHNIIKQMQDLSASASESPDILLALTWLQIQIVESGIYIDSLREDFDTGMAYYLRYDSQIEGDNYNAHTLLTIDEKLNKLSGRIKWMVDNPL